MSNIKNAVYNHSKDVYKSIESLLKRADRDDIANANGALKLGHEGAKKGSFIYLLFDENDYLLYVGETGTSIKKRLIGDGGGAHIFNNRLMYDETRYIKYLRTDKKDTLSPMERKMIEQAITIYLKPKYYNKEIWKY